MKVKAELKNYRQSSRKVRLVADLVRGKGVEKTLAELHFLDKKASSVIKKLIESAVANAKHNFNIDKKDLIVSEIRVDEGPTLKRLRAGARGRGFRINKRTSRILLVLSNGEKIEKKETKEKTKEKKETKVTKKIKSSVKKKEVKKTKK